MAAFSVLEPPPRGNESALAPERVVFVRDRFNWAAFFFGALWMIWHRLWLVLLGYLVVLAALEGIFRLTGTSTTSRMAVEILLALLVGLEAASLRRWTLVRRGWQEHDLIVAQDRETAERRFFADWSGNAPAPAALASGSTMAAPVAMPRPAAGGSAGVLGLFPQPGGTR